MAPYARPETALRRADELLAVGQPNAALSAVSEIFASKRFRSTPLSQLEPIVLRFLELCVQLRKGRTARQGLHAYRNVAQNTSVSSLETVLQAFVKRSKDRLVEALKQAEELAPAKSGESATAAEGAEVEDLEATETPESILLSAVSDEDSHDRTHRTIVTPWLRFLWEAYRTALDILRNNVRLELPYQTLAHDALAFCLEHQRKTEFRRLCETLRMHLASSQKYTHQTHSINLSDPDTLQRHLDTRFQQLNTAVELELWQEAFRSAEDIHGLVVLSKRAPKASMMATYYEQLVRVFAVGSNFLFHAAAYSKWHIVQPPPTAANAEAERKAAALVLLSALAVPVGAVGPSTVRRDGVVVEDSEAAKGKASRLAALLALSATPTRAGLLRDALRRDVLRRVSPELRTLYRMLEVDVDPLDLVSAVDPILTGLGADPETARYVEPLRTVVLSRLFENLGQVYDSLDLETAITLGQFPSEREADAKSARARVERFIAQACRRGDLDATLDHAGASLKFNRELFTPVSDTADLAPMFQPSPGALLRTQLVRLGEALRAATEPGFASAGIEKARELQRTALAALAEKMPAERKAILKRKHTLAERRKQADEARQARDAEEAKARAARMAAKAEELARAEQAAKRQRELDMVRKEADAARAADAAKLAASLVEKGAISTIAPQDLSKMDRDEIVQLSVDQAEKMRKELAQSGMTVAKRMDYLERAMRQEERPLLEIDYQQQQERDRIAHEVGHKALIDASKAAFEADVASRDKLARILGDYRDYRQRVGGQAEEKRKAKEQAAREAIAKEKQQRIANKRAELQRDREQRAELERLEREREEHERAEAERLQAEEEARIAREAEERAAAEEKARAEKQAADAAREARAAERLKLDEQAAKQRAREAEVEARMAERSKAPARAPVVGSGTWTRREQPAAPAATAAAAPAAPTERKPLNLAPRSNAQPSWRDREAAKAAAGGTPPADGAAPPPAASQTNGASSRPESPAARPSSGITGSVQNATAPRWQPSSRPAATDGAAKPTDDDGFTTVKKPAPAGGKYIPPSQRQASGAGGAGGSRWR